MTRRVLLVFALCAALGYALSTRFPARAQTATPFLEPTANCQAVSFWWADLSYRPPARNNDVGVQPRLVLFNGGLLDQQVVVRVRDTAGMLESTVLVAAKRRAVLDVGTTVLQGRASDFAMEVDFAGLGAADVKVWGLDTASVPPLALCR